MSDKVKFIMLCYLQRLPYLFIYAELIMCLQEYLDIPVCLVYFVLRISLFFRIMQKL